MFACVGQSLVRLLVHSVFSTKERRPFLPSEEIHNEIANQAEHHLKFSFQDEFRQLLKRHHTAFDERSAGFDLLKKARGFAIVSVILFSSAPRSRASTTTKCLRKTSELSGQRYQKGPVYVECI